MQISNRIGFGLLMTLALAVSACGPRVPAKPVDAQKAAQAAYSDIAAVAALPQALDQDTQLVLKAYNIKLPNLPAPTSLDVKTFSNPAASVQTVDVQQWLKNSYVQQGTQENPDHKFLRGTYTVNADGTWSKEADTPTDGLVVKFTVNGVQLTESTKYKEIIVGQISPTKFQEYLLDAEMTLKKGNTTLLALNFNTDAQACYKDLQNGGYMWGLAISKLSGNLNLNNQVTGNVNFQVAGTKASGSLNVNVSAGGHTASVKASGELTSAADMTPTCANMTQAPNFTGGSLDVKATYDKDSAHLKASVSNLKNANDNTKLEGDVDVTLTVETPEVIGTVFSAKGNLKDGTDAGTLPGDQVAVVAYLPKNQTIVKVETTLEDLLKMNNPSQN